MAAQLCSIFRKMASSSPLSVMVTAARAAAAHSGRGGRAHAHGKGVTAPEALHSRRGTERCRPLHKSRALWGRGGGRRTCRTDLGGDYAGESHSCAELHDALAPEIGAVVRQELGE